MSEPGLKDGKDGKDGRIARIARIVGAGLKPAPTGQASGRCLCHSERSEESLPTLGGG